MSLNVFVVLNVIISTSQNYIFFSSDKIEKIKFLGAIVRGKDLNCYVGSQAPITNKSTPEEDKTFGKAP